MANALLQVKVDSELKKQVDDLFFEIGLDIPTAIRMFFKKAVYEHGIPFKVKKVKNFKSNKKLLEALREADDIAKHPENYKSYFNFQEILDEIHNEGNEE
jgi:DNA-damage-inducible protein J